VKTSWLEAPTPTLNRLLVAEARGLLVPEIVSVSLAVSVYWLPTVLIEHPEKVTTPWNSSPWQVFDSAPGPPVVGVFGDMVRVTAEKSDVTMLLLASSTSTIGCEPKAVPAKEFPGEVRNTRWVAGAGTGSGLEAGSSTTKLKGALVTPLAEDVTVIVTSWGAFTTGAMEVLTTHAFVLKLDVALFQYFVGYPVGASVAEYPEGRLNVTLSGTGHCPNCEFVCCSICEIACSAAVRSTVSRVAILRCSAEPEIDVANAMRMATDAKPSTTMARRTSTRVSPSSERRNRLGLVGDTSPCGGCSRRFMTKEAIR
jgi:hypothetical protein